LILTRAPLRIPLGGGGTDFPSHYLKNGGFIVGFALDKSVHVVLNRTIDKKIRLKYSLNETVSHPDELKNRVAAEALKWYGIDSGIEISTFSDVPESSGLGGSSAFCVALVTALRRLLKKNLDKMEIFASAYDIERNKAGQPGGIQDQFFSAHGGSWCITLDKKGCVQDGIEVTGLLPRLYLMYAGNQRSSLDIAVRQTEKSTKKDSSMISNLKSIEEAGKEVASSIVTRDYDRIGSLFNDHWHLKKKRDSSIVVNGLDTRLKDVMTETGSTGGKLIGLGGGGYFLLYSPKPIKQGKFKDLIPVGIDYIGSTVVYES
jgi:D-glycero-alpha-D-manno-heptose-7-phosphate kinase